MAILIRYTYRQTTKDILKVFKFKCAFVYQNILFAFEYSTIQIILYLCVLTQTLFKYNT